VIRWIMQILRGNQDSLSDYTLEYATALLMNLSLRSKGKDACQKLAPEIHIIRELSEMMEHSNAQVRTHVNGTLYSILTRKSLKDQAEEIGMQEMLAYLVQNQDQQLQRQIQYIQNQLNSEPEQEEAEPDDEEDDDEDDYDDDYEEGDEDIDDDQGILEDGEFDDTLRIEGVLTGEEWLTSNFMLANNEALDQTAVIQKRIIEEQKDRMNKSDISRSNRPVSPFASNNGDNPFGDSKSGYANPSSDRSMLSAMKTRDKIPRTPVEGAKRPWKEDFVAEKPFNMQEYMRKHQSKDDT